MKHLILLWIFSTVCFSASVQELAEGFANHADFDGASIGLYIVDVGSGEVVANVNGEKCFTPASTQKLLTTIGALELLSGEDQFETQLEYDGEISPDGVLKGNVYIYGGGDPTFGSPRGERFSHLGVFRKWKEALMTKGVWKIEGNVIADCSRWVDEGPVGTWYYEDLGNYFGAAASALTFHENLYYLHLQSGEEGGSVEVKGTTPREIHASFENGLRAAGPKSGDQAWIFTSMVGVDRVLKGTIPCGQEQFTIKGALPNPPLVCAEMFKGYLKELGIEVDGGVKVQSVAGAGRKCLDVHSSPRIEELVEETNQKSVNLYAEHLLKKVGEEAIGVGSTESGALAIKTFFENEGIDCKKVRIQDGSGLSRSNVVTPKFLTDLLVYMKGRDSYRAFNDSLPVAGSARGGLSHFGKDSVLRGQVRAKTGYAGQVRALSGYLALGNREFAFAIIANYLINGGDRWKDHLVTFLERVVAQESSRKIDLLKEGVSANYYLEQAKP
ncbi:MAG: D-alanyl-D-alanine carboxypeptidase DacB [Chlamydiia bacterium]|nr:D-alanyl-D-alanine carboxypeptidase DacB [Chlamydiia bacterium]